MVRNRQRLTLIGPVPPMRGGIAQHTDSLRAALARRVDLLTLAYRRMYPRLLFPGRTLLEPGTIEIPPDDTARDIRFAIDALDPRSWRSAVRSVRAHDSTGVIIPWWTAALAVPAWYLARGSRRTGARVTMLCHNVVDHESARWKRTAAAAVFAQCDRFVTSSQPEADRLRALLPDAVVVVHPHPVYHHLPDPPQRLPRRAARELLFFGLVRPYKGLDVLIDALAAIPDVDWHLTVAGEQWQDVSRMHEQLRGAGLENRVEWIDSYLAAGTVATMFARADVVILPYRHATGCGVLSLALGAGKPVIASDVAGIREQVEEGETGWLVPAGNAAALAAAIAGIDADLAAAMKPAVHRLARTWTWDSLAQAVHGEW